MNEQTHLKSLRTVSVAFLLASAWDSAVDSSVCRELSSLSRIACLSAVLVSDSINWFFSKVREATISAFSFWAVCNWTDND